MNFYIIELVIEADNISDAEEMVSQMIDETKSYYDISINGTREMTSEEILNHFGRTKEEIENGEYI